ncbi:hypothetical protein C8J56DRAFT_1126967 [Mycena floridula]|nr:hypothetical protein C8J56DRAFT_1126967 [Mycena floridula]
MNSTRPLGWSQLPVELLILVAENCSLSDALIIPQVCRAFRETFQHRIAWITILKAFRERKCGPLACPAHDDLSTRNLENLKDLAVLALRVQRGFRSDSVQMESQYRPPILTLTAKPPSFHCSGDVVLLGLIPGTDFGLFMNETNITCWNIVKGKQMSSIEFGISTEDFLTSETGICEAPGRWLTAIDGHDESSDIYTVIVLAVDHNESFECPVVSVACRGDTMSTSRPLSVALNPGMVASVSRNTTTGLLSILAINLISGREHRISTDIYKHDGMVVAQFVDEELYMFNNTDDHHAFYHFPRQFFPYFDILTPLAHLGNGMKGFITRSQIIHGLQSERASSSNTIVELVGVPDGDLSPASVLFLEYEMGPATIQTKHSRFDLPTDLLHDQFSFLLSAPSNAVVFDLIDPRKEEGHQRTYYLLRFENKQGAGSRPSLAELKFPAEVERELSQDFDDISLEINADKGEIVVLFGEENKVLRLSYLP